MKYLLIINMMESFVLFTNLKPTKKQNCRNNTEPKIKICARDVEQQPILHQVKGLRSERTTLER
jgi:hypothetical protein